MIINTLNGYVDINDKDIEILSEELDNESEGEERIPLSTAGLFSSKKFWHELFILTVKMNGKEFQLTKRVKTYTKSKRVKTYYNTSPELTTDCKYYVDVFEDEAKKMGYEPKEI